MKVLHPDEARRLIATVDLRDPFGPRDRAMLVFCLHTGLRVSELVGLDVDHVAVDRVPRQALYVPPDLGKGHRERTIPLNEVARQAVATILDLNRRRGFSIASNAPLFVTKKHERMNVRAVQRLVQALREKARLDVPATPHTFRHTFASRVASRNANLRVVQLLLGHLRLQTVQIYTHPTRREMASAVECLAEGGDLS